MKTGTGDGMVSSSCPMSLSGQQGSSYKACSAAAAVLKPSIGMRLECNRTMLNVCCTDSASHGTSKHRVRIWADSLAGVQQPNLCLSACLHRHLLLCLGACRLCCQACPGIWAPQECEAERAAWGHHQSPALAFEVGLPHCLWRHPCRSGRHVTGNSRMLARSA